VEMSKEIISVTYKSGKSEMDKHPHFRNEKDMEEIIAKIKFRRLIRRMIKLINCKKDETR
jgi:hypothetical protein